MLCNQISNFKDYYTTVACQSSIYIFQCAYNCILNRSRGLYQGNTVSGLGKKVNRPKYVLMQLCLILSAYAGNHTIAVVKGMEDYKTISAVMHL